MNTFNAVGYFKDSNNVKLVQSFPSKTGKGEFLKLSFGVSIPEKNQTTFVTLLGGNSACYSCSICCFKRRTN